MRRADRVQTLARRTITNGRGHTHFASTEGLPLSLKCMFNGRARYTVGRAELCVDDGGFMIVNEAQPYTIDIASPTQVESFILWFPSGWAEEVARTLDSPSAAQLDDPGARGETRVEFFTRYIRHDAAVMPRVQSIRTACKSGCADDTWLEERLRDVLAAMLRNERGVVHDVSSISAERATTREELWRRLHRGRDFIHANASNDVGLSDAARAACLSPFHFLRSFRQVFGITPHQFLTRCRIGRAKFLLERTELPITEVCFDAGFVGVGSFTTLFHRSTGLSPRAWRLRHAKRSPENSNIREVFLTCRR